MPSIPSSQQAMPPVPSSQQAIPSIPSDLSSTLARMIIYSLQSFGCHKWDIYDVLRSYGYHGSRPEFAAIIGDEACWKLCGDVEKHISEINYHDGFPIQIMIKCSGLPDVTPTRNAIAKDTRGRAVYTKVSREIFWCELDHSDIYPEAYTWCRWTWKLVHFNWFQDRLARVLFSHASKLAF